MNIVLTGGGTGGHVMPFESIIESLRRLYTEKKDTLPNFVDRDELHITFLGISTTESIEFFQRYEVEMINIPSGKLRRYASTSNIIDIAIFLPIGIIKALYHMWRIMPDVVISKGGYASIPTVLSAIFYRIPILLHESDVVPGSSNQFMMRFASAITLGFAVSRDYLQQYKTKLFVTGTPIRTLLATDQKKESKQSFGFPIDEKVLLVMGGSQGAKQINEALLSSLKSLIVSTAIIHITGEAHHTAVETIAKEFLANSPRKDLYKSFASLKGQEMSRALMASDIAVTRAGASSLAEIAQLRIPSLIIPLEGAANDHQTKNALAFESAGAALVLAPSNVSPNLLLRSVMRLIEDDHLRELLANNLTALDYPNASTDIAELAIQLASGFRPRNA